MTTRNTLQPALTLKEAAGELGISPYKASQLIEEGQLLAMNVARKDGKRAHWRIERSDLDAYKERAKDRTRSRFPGGVA